MQQQSQGIQELIVQVSQGALVVDGGLSKLCTDALIELYPQEQDQSLSITLESYEVDLVNTLGVWDGLRAANKIPSDPQERINYLYAARQGDVTMSDVLRFASALDAMEDAQATLYMADDEIGPNVMAAEMLKLAKSRGVKVIHNLQELTEHYRGAK